MSIPGMPTLDNANTVHFGTYGNVEAEKCTSRLSLTWIIGKILGLVVTVSTEDRGEQWVVLNKKSFAEFKSKVSQQNTEISSKWNRTVIKNITNHLKKTATTIQTGSDTALRKDHTEKLKLLQNAVRKRDIGTTKSILEDGLYQYLVNEPLENNGQTSTLLIEAVKNENLELVELLMDKGADLKACDSSKNTALFAAIESEDPGIVERLLTHDLQNKDILNTPCFLKDGTSSTPLILAVKTGNEQLVQLCIEKGADITATDSFKNSALFVAIQSGNREIAKLLIDKSSPELLNKPCYLKNGTSTTLLMQCIEKKDAELAALLIDKGADLFQYDGNGYTALHTAVYFENKEMTQLLLEKCPEEKKTELLNYTTEVGKKTALMLAANLQNESDQMITLLCKAGADITAVDETGWSALHDAVDQGNCNSVHALLMNCPEEKKESLLALKNDQNETALEWATKCEFQPIIDMFKGKPIEQINTSSLDLKKRIEPHKKHIQEQADILKKLLMLEDASKEEVKKQFYTAYTSLVNEQTELGSKRLQVSPELKQQLEGINNVIATHNIFSEISLQVAKDIYTEKVIQGLKAFDPDKATFNECIMMYETIEGVISSHNTEQIAINEELLKSYTALQKKLAVILGKREIGACLPQQLIQIHATIQSMLKNPDLPEEQKKILTNRANTIATTLYEMKIWKTKTQIVVGKVSAVASQIGSYVPWNWVSKVLPGFITSAVWDRSLTGALMKTAELEMNTLILEGVAEKVRMNIEEWRRERGVENPEISPQYRQIINGMVKLASITYTYRGVVWGVGRRIIGAVTGL